MDNLRDKIRTIPHYPKPGIMFRDVTTLMGDGAALAAAVEQLAAGLNAADVDMVAGIEARGFIFGAPLAVRLDAGFVPMRKKGKLPHTTMSESYDLEYGTDDLEIHADAVEPGQRVLIIDDLIATGGTAGAAVKLLQRAGAEIVEARFVIDLPALGGAEKLRALGIDVRALMSFEGE